MDVLKLILDYIKVLMWPAMLFLSVFFYEDELLYLLENREIEAFGISIGSQIQELSA